MRKKGTKITSLFLSFFMAFSIIFSSPVNALAHSTDVKSKDNVINSLREIVKEDSKENIIKNEIKNNEEKVTFIVEIEDKAIKDYVGDKPLKEASQDKSLVDKVLASQKPYKEKIKNINKEAKFKNEYVLLINGFSVEAKLSDMEKIEEIKGVKHISIAKEYFRDMNYSLDLGKVKEVYKQYGYKGEGMVVSVIDSGIDYTHKDMVLSKDGRAKAKLTEEVVKNINNSNSEAKGKYFTEKIPYGYNFVDKNHEVIDKAIGNVGYMHGMHVAGIIGANCQNPKDIENSNGIKGVAPEAQLLAMKIFSNNPEMNNACEGDVIAAIEDSVAHGADVINMSISGSAGFQDPEDGQQKAIREAVKRGVMVIVAGGNAYYSTYPNKYEGVLDTGVIGMPGIEHDSIQVASYNNSIATCFVLNYNSTVENGKIPYALTDFDIRELMGEHEVVDCGLGRVIKESNIDDFKGKDLKGKIALIKRGQCEFKDKKINAQERGALGVIIYNFDEDDTILDSTAFDKNVLIPSIFIKNSDGEKLKKVVSKGLKVSFKNELLERENDKKEEISEFSSFGPTPNLDLKPDITGVGGNVWSTVNSNSYKSMSGTSMATPYTAGISALLLQHTNSLNLKFNNLRDRVRFNKALMMNTAQIQMNKKHNIPYSPRRQGAGLIDAENALKNKVIITYKGEPSAALKVIDRITSIPIELKNYGEKSITYKIEAPSGVLTEVDSISEGVPHNIKLEGANIKFDKNEVTVNPGETAKVNATITLDNSVSKDRFIEGFIKFIPKDSREATIGMPYMGFYGDWAGLQILDNPNYTGKSIIGESTLLSATQSLFGYESYFIGSGKNSKAEHFAINPDDSYCINNALPQVTFLRNAKKLRIDVTNEKGEVIRVIDEKTNLRKDVFAEELIKAKTNYNWIWDGKVYNKDLGKRVTVENGQYYINMRVTSDIENAKEQVITFPVKVDKVAPNFKSPKLVIANSSNCNLELEASDGKEGSGISGFVFMINNDNYIDEEGNKIFKLQQDPKNHKYNMNLKLPQSSNPIHKVYMGCIDYAKNLAPQETTIIDASKSNLNISIDKNSYKSGESIELKYNFTDSSKEDKVSHYEILVDNFSTGIKNNKKQSYTINNKLKGGEHFIIVKAIDAKGNSIDVNAVKFNVDEIGEGEEEKTNKVKIENLTENQVYYKGQNATIKIKASNFTKGNKDVTLIVGVYNEKGVMVNTSIASKTIKENENIIMDTSIFIPKKENHKIKVFVWDNLEEQIPYTNTIEIVPIS